MIANGSSARNLLSNAIENGMSTIENYKMINKKVFHILIVGPKGRNIGI